jgi:hypothetical protein
MAAVAALTQNVLLRRANAEVAAGLLLPYLIKASYAQQNLVFSAFMDFATPQDILFAALAVAKHDRDSRALLVAAELLEHYGAEADPILTRLARSGKPECRYFVRMILSMEERERREEAIAALAQRGHLDTRRELLDETDRSADEIAVIVCRLLMNDPDERIRELSREKLISLES